MAEDKKESIIGNIICRAKKSAFSYRLTEKDRRDWWREGGYRDRLYNLLSKLTLPELEEASQWTDDEIRDLIECATEEVRPKTEGRTTGQTTYPLVEIAEVPPPSRDRSQERIDRAIDRAFDWPKRQAEIKNIEADAELKKKLGKFLER